MSESNDLFTIILEKVSETNEDEFVNKLRFFSEISAEGKSIALSLMLAEQITIRNQISEFISLHLQVTYNQDIPERSLEIARKCSQALMSTKEELRETSQSFLDYAERRDLDPFEDVLLDTMTVTHLMLRKMMELVP